MCAKSDEDKEREKVEAATMQSLVDALGPFGWPARSARIGIRASGRCEYCDKDLFASGLAHLEWQTDHIVPISAGGCDDDDDNLALACWHCNFKLKGHWNPRSDCPQNATRKELIAAIRTHCQTQLERKEREVAAIREILRTHGIRPTAAPQS